MTCWEWVSSLAWMGSRITIKKEPDQTLFGTPISTCLAKVKGDMAIGIYMLS
jgi:hypothetical protein